MKIIFLFVLFLITEQSVLQLSSNGKAWKSAHKTIETEHGGNSNLNNAYEQDENSIQNDIVLVNLVVPLVAALAIGLVIAIIFATFLYLKHRRLRTELADNQNDLSISSDSSESSNTTIEAQPSTSRSVSNQFKRKSNIPVSTRKSTRISNKKANIV